MTHFIYQYPPMVLNIAIYCLSWPLEAILDHFRAFKQPFMLIQAFQANAQWAIRPKKAFATNLLTLLMTLSPSLCSLSFLTSSPSLSVTPSDHRVLSQPLALPIYLNKLSLDDSLHAISSNLGV